MRILLLVLFLSGITSALCAQDKPRLVVGIVIDQMRNDYLQRYADKLSDKGFKRMMNQGFVAKNNQYNYIPTYTAPGHASIYTGTVPKYHGIIANSWYSRVLDRSVYCVGDSTTTNIGGSAMAGSISPRNLQVNTITDELKLASNFRSKVVSISLKDRGAVLPAGHLSDGTYWYDGRTGEFMTSDFYKDQLPKWVKDFNDQKLVDVYSNQVWDTLLPIEEYTESTVDNTPYERGFEGKDTPTFPYNLEKLRLDNGPYGLIRTTPFGNTLVLDMARAAMEGEQLGKDKFTDFLCISLSSPDHIGHNFAPNSIEVEDTYLRLDQELGKFLEHLDQKIGQDNYLVFLTADHGVVENPTFLMDHQLPGGFIDTDAENARISKAIANLYGKGNWILNVSNQQLFLNHQLISESEKDRESVQREIAEIILDSEAVLDIMIASDLSRYDYSDPLRSRLQNGYNRKLSGDILALTKPGYLSGQYGEAGTSHGSGYNYDTHVPLLFYGSGIRKGATVRTTHITDIAPTLSLLLNISIPNAAVTGEPIKELFE